MAILRRLGVTDLRTNEARQAWFNIDVFLESELDLGRSSSLPQIRRYRDPIPNSEQSA